MTTAIADSLARLRAEIGDVRLIAVSKTHSRDAVQAALEAGQRAFGENRVQEAVAKFAGLHAVWPGLDLHLIGPLQTNKVAAAIALFDTIQTLDRPRLADALAAAFQTTAKRPHLYIEINSAAEPQKAGIAPGDLDSFLSYCRDACALTITGLMCVPPQGRDPRPYFMGLRELADRHGLPRRSMGMSGDYAVAVACGATDIRVGSAIFGSRERGKSYTVGPNNFCNEL